MAVLNKVYRFRLRPTLSQGQAFMRLAGARRFVWNWALDRRKAYYAEHGKTIPAAQLSAELTALKRQPGTDWLKEADSQALQQTLVDLDRAFRNFFEGRARFPRFKSRKRDAPRFRIPQRVKIAEGKVSPDVLHGVRLNLLTIASFIRVLLYSLAKNADLSDRGKAIENASTSASGFFLK